MKVLHLLDTVNRGGAEVLVLDVCRNAADYGIDLTFVTTQGGELETDFEHSGAKFFRLNRRFPIDFGAILKLRKIIKDGEIQIVHAHQGVDGLHLYLASIGLPVKRVLSFHGFIADAKNRRTLRFLIPRMNANIVVSRALQNWLEETDALNVRQNFHVVYNGTDSKRLVPTGKSLRKELKLNENAFLIGMIGNFYRDPRKDQFTLCRSLPKVLAEIENVCCIFVGKTEAGAEDKLLECETFCNENGIAEKVRFLGTRNDIPDILAELDVFVFSSLQEGLPIAMTEAMLAKVPLIVSAIEPLLEASENGKYAEVFPVKNAEILSEKILYLLKNKIERENLAVRAFEFAENNFSIEIHLKKLKKLYESILKD